MFIIEAESRLATKIMVIRKKTTIAVLFLCVLKKYREIRCFVAPPISSALQRLRYPRIRSSRNDDIKKKTKKNKTKQILKKK